MKLSKTVSILVAIALIVNLAVQLLSILALTRTKLGKLVRHNVIGIMYDAFDESIDEASKRMPGMMKKIESISDSIEQ